MAKIHLRLLGQTRISRADGAEIGLPTQKARALLIYLASPPGIARSRSQLSGLLWSLSAEDQARSSLRQNLSRLRKALGHSAAAIEADAQAVSLAVDAVESDVLAFESAIRSGDPAALDAVADLLDGEFAAGLAIKEAPFEEWLSAERRRIAELAIQALGRLLARCEARGDHDRAGALARRLLAVDSLQEKVHRALMRALAKQGRFESAVQQYRICRDILRKDLGIEPDPETQSLYEDIVRARLGSRQPKLAPAVETAGLVRALNQAAAPGAATPPAGPTQLRGLDLTLPERPSIVILPFRNLTGDTADDPLAEGIRIDIQAALVKITGLFLIAAGSANAMRSRSPTEAAQAMGVRHVLQGSVRRSGDAVRLSVELTDGVAGNVVWSEHFDRRLDDSFDLQDEIVERVITALDVKLVSGEQARVWHKTLKDRNALETFYKGVEEFFKLQKDSVARARTYFEAVDRRQPEVSIGATWTALCHWFDAFKRWGDDPEDSLRLAGEWAERAVAMADADGQAHMVLSHVHLLNRRFDEALVVGREAISLRPNCTNANGFFANVLHYCGEQREAIDHVTWAIRYSPVYPPFFAEVLALACLFEGDRVAAAAVAAESRRLNPTGVTALLVLTAAHAGLEDFAAARAAARDVITADPRFSLKRFLERQPYRNPADLSAYIASLRAAGLPD